MNKSSNYRLIKKRWFFWVPLILMITSFLPNIGWILYDLTSEAGAFAIPFLLFYFFVTIIFVLSYLLLNRILHFFIGIISVITSWFYPFYFLKETFDFTYYESYITILPFICLLVSGFFFIYWSFKNK